MSKRRKELQDALIARIKKAAAAPIVGTDDTDRLRTLLRHAINTSEHEPLTCDECRGAYRFVYGREPDAPTDKPAPEPGNAWAPDNCPHCGGTNRLHKGWPCFGPAPDASASVLTNKLRAILADADADGGVNERDDPWDYRLVEAVREALTEIDRVSTLHKVLMAEADKRLEAAEAETKLKLSALLDALEQRDKAEAELARARQAIELALADLGDENTEAVETGLRAFLARDGGKK